MADKDGRPKRAPRRNVAKAASSARPRGWADRVAFVPGAEGYAYVPGEVVTTGDVDLQRVADRLFPGTNLEVSDVSRS